MKQVIRVIGETMPNLGPLAFNEEVLFILDGKYVVDRFRFDKINAARIESRRSFAHPAIGIAFGGVCITASLGAFIVALAMDGEWSVAWGFVFLTLAGLGSYCVIAAARSRMVPWLVLETIYGMRAYRMHGEITPEVEAFVATLKQPPDESSPAVP